MLTFACAMFHFSGLSAAVTSGAKCPSSPIAPVEVLIHTRLCPLNMITEGLCRGTLETRRSSREFGPNEYILSFPVTIK